jgi:GTP-binding protein
MLPVVAIVGRPNVGKSTLFNALTKTRLALVADIPGLTRDRHYGSGRVGPVPYVVVDTGGMVDDPQNFGETIEAQALTAVGEADVVLFLVDAKSGITAADQIIADKLRRIDKKIHLVMNKSESVDHDVAKSDFYSLGYDELASISAAHRQGVSDLMSLVLAPWKREHKSLQTFSKLDEPKTIEIAIVGRPNVGKSTLVNRLLGEERVLAADQAGTTRDSIRVPFERDGQHYTLIDTAGIRRRARVDDVIEKFSVIKSMQSIESSNVVLMMLDARQGISEQDATLLGYVLSSGKALVMAVNKWDHLSTDERNEIRRNLSLKLDFVDFAKMHFISALHGSGIMDLFESVKMAYRAATKDLNTKELTTVLEGAVMKHQPPIVKGNRVKLRYAHQGGRNPPIVVIHGNKTDQLPESYKRYLVNVYRKAFKLYGTPIQIEVRSGSNPFEPRGFVKKQTHRLEKDDRISNKAKKYQKRPK